MIGVTMMNTIILMIGIQGSGKSTFCKRLLAGKYERINLDTLKTRNNENRLLAECFAEKRDFVVDNTNPTKEERSRYIVQAKENGYHVVGYFMRSCLQECIARNNQREGEARLPAKAIAATSNRLEMPSYAEGFDELYFVDNDGENMTISYWREE